MSGEEEAGGDTDQITVAGQLTDDIRIRQWAVPVGRLISSTFAQ